MSQKSNLSSNLPVAVDPVWALVALLWFVVLLYGFSVVWWVVETAVLARGWRVDDDEIEWGFDDIQVRILTIDAAEVVQATVDSIPDGIEDVRVVAEEPVEVSGATVHVVPEALDCTATNKGRAVEWARRYVGCDNEYVLYLDEDTLVTGFEGLPDADVVQFTEKPLYTGSKAAYLCEVFRVGYQFEQLGFHRLRYPLYAWGGGVAIRASLEDRIGWDVETITEDTSFVWRAADAGDLTFRILDTRFRNQAPPSVRALLRQRRRWISGTVRDGHLLPTRYRPLYYSRVVAWALSPFVPLLALVGYLWPAGVPTLGALWGFVRPVRTFEVTEKLTPERVEATHDTLDRGDIAAHEGTDRLIRDSDETFSGAVFDD